MKDNPTFIRKTHCILTAYRLEHCWKKLLRAKKKERGADSRFAKKLELQQARVRYLTARYAILVRGAEHPERLAI